MKTPYEEFSALTGLRGILALWVVWCHLTIGLSTLVDDLPALLPESCIQLALAGFLAVDIFFALSGFVLSHVYTQQFTGGRRRSVFSREWQGEALRFWVLRLGKIYPVHFCVLLCYLLAKFVGVIFVVETCGNPLEPAAGCDRFGPVEFLRQLLMVGSWQVSVPAVTTWNLPAWSVNSEWFAYLLFPFIISPLSKIGKGSVAVVLAGSSLIVMCATLSLTGYLPASGAQLHEYGLIRLSFGFVSGCLLYRFRISLGYARVPWGKLGLPALALLLVLLGCGEKHIVLPALLIGMFLLLSLSQSEGTLTALLSSRFLIWLGNISYSVYMVHILAIETFGLLIENQAPPASLAEILGMYSGLTIAVVLIGAAMFYIVERPTQRLVRRMFSS